MHALGNDFVILFNDPKHFQVTALQQLADRHIGIGCDQILFIQPINATQFNCHIYNADGTQAEQCGNGLRCAAKLIFTSFNLTQFSICTSAGEFFPTFLNDHLISMGLSHPTFLDVKSLEELWQSVPAKLEFVSYLSLGNPHIIFLSTDLSAPFITHTGRMISTHAAFPQGVNVGFMQILQPDSITLRTYERGAGPTFACGSNASAAVIAGIHTRMLANNVNVQLTLGALNVQWQADLPVVLTGPAEFVYKGDYAVD